MGWFGRRRKRTRVARESHEVSDALVEHLKDFMASRRGVEAWVEQPTSFNAATLLLVAGSGESTRRAVPSVEYAHDFARQHHIPCYDAGVVPYPQRMRDYQRRQRGAQDSRS